MVSHHRILLGCFPLWSPSTLSPRPTRVSTLIRSVRDYELISVGVGDHRSNELRPRELDEHGCDGHGSPATLDLFAGRTRIGVTEDDARDRSGVSSILAGCLDMHRQEGRRPRKGEHRPASLFVETQFFETEDISVERSSLLKVSNVDGHCVKPGNYLTHGPAVAKALLRPPFRDGWSEDTVQRLLRPSDVRPLACGPEIGSRQVTGSTLPGSLARNVRPLGHPRAYPHEVSHSHRDGSSVGPRDPARSLPVGAA